MDFAPRLSCVSTTRLRSGALLAGIFTAFFASSHQAALADQSDAGIASAGGVFTAGNTSIGIASEAGSTTSIFQPFGIGFSAAVVDGSTPVGASPAAFAAGENSEPGNVSSHDGENTALRDLMSLPTNPSPGFTRLGLDSAGGVSPYRIGSTAASPILLPSATAVRWQPGPVGVGVNRDAEIAELRAEIHHLARENTALKTALERLEVRLNPEAGNM